jgi:hypothetical protein
MWVAFGGMLLSIIGPLVGRVLLALGLGYVTYKGVDVSTAFLMDQVKSNMGALPSTVVNFLAYCWVDKAIGMIASTWAACMAFSGLTGAITKLRMKGG